MNNILIWRHFVILVSFKRRRSLTSGGGAGIFKCQSSLLCGETKMAESSTAMEDGQDWKMAEAQAMEQDEQVETGWETGAGGAADGGSTECHNWHICYPEDTPHFKWTNHPVMMKMTTSFQTQNWNLPNTPMKIVGLNN